MHYDGDDDNDGVGEDDAEIEHDLVPKPEYGVSVTGCRHPR